MKPRVWLSLLAMNMTMVARADTYYVSTKASVETPGREAKPLRTIQKADIGAEFLPAVTVPRWEMHEFELHGRSHVDNPFRDTALMGEFMSPSGKKILTEGFYDGGDTWRLRFTPDEEGQWRYILRGEGVELFQQGQLQCVTPGNSHERLDAVFELIQEAVEKGQVPGAIALVAHNGQIVRHETFGFSDPERQIPFRTDTLCWIASVTKPVTVAAAMTLVDGGKLSLDDPVEKYLPEFREQKDPNGEHHAFTIRHLMTHTSGIVNDPPTRPRGVWAIGGALEDSWLTATDHAGIVSAIAQSRLLFKPGSQVRYSSAAMFVLGTRRRVLPAWRLQRDRGLCRSQERRRRHPVFSVPRSKRCDLAAR